jgi:hypothetical protein
MAVKRSYVRRNIALPRVPISPDQVAKRQSEIEEKQEYLEKLKSGGQMSDGTTAMKTGDMDIAALEKQLERDKKALEYLEPKEGNASEKRKAQLEFNEAKAYIGKYGLTFEEMGKYPKVDNPEKQADYNKAVDKCIAQEVGNPEFTRMCNQLKRAASILEPMNPELRNVNNCRMER